MDPVSLRAACGVGHVVTCKRRASDMQGTRQKYLVFGKVPCFRQRRAGDACTRDSGAQVKNKRHTVVKTTGAPPAAFAAAPVVASPLLEPAGHQAPVTNPQKS